MRYCLLFILLHSVSAYGQTRWINQIHSETESLGISVIETYDHGFLLNGKFGSDYVHYFWLQKTDLNGQFLWEKVIGDTEASIFISKVAENPDGSTYLSITTSYYDAFRDPLVMKLNNCGQKEWCRVFYSPGNYDYSHDIISIDDGGCVILMNNTGPDSNYYAERTALAKLSSDGELIWRHDYNSPDNHSQGEILVNLLETNDKGFLISGTIDYEDPIFPGRYWMKPYYIKVDSLGIFEWETIVHKDIWEIGGAAWSTTLNPDSTFFYSSISHYYHSPSSSCPAMLKMDFNGNVIAIYDVVQGFKEGKLSYGTFINDSILAASAGWGNTEDSLWSRAIIIDTLGNLLNSSILMQDLYTSILQVTYDGKLVYLSNTYQDGQFGCFLTKLNQNLEDDTIYTQPFTYDSLCPYQIVSDTIVQDDCGVIVGIEEEDKTIGRYDDRKGEMEVWPNPAKTIVNCQLSTVDFQYNSTFSNDHLSLVIYDIFGREVMTEKVTSTLQGGGREGSRSWQINVESYPPGIYIVILKNGADLLESRKFVIAR